MRSIRGVKKLFDLDERFREMDQFGDYRQIISLPNPPIEDFAPGAVGLFELARIGNDDIHVIFAADKLIASRPEAVRAFLQGWFEAMAFMRTNKAETVAIAKEVTDKDEEITARSYDELMPDVLRRRQVQP